MYFDNYASDDDCVLEHVVIEYAGYASNDCVVCNGSSPTLNECVITNGAGSAIYCANGASPTIYACSIQDNSVYGILCNGAGSNPLITNCIITGNSYGVHVMSGALPVIGGTDGLGNILEGNLNYGVRNTSSSTCVEAQFNWWGDALGPDDDVFATDDCVDDGNDNNAGDTVSEDVNYLNWAIAPVYTPVPNPTATPTTTPTMTPTITPTPTVTVTPEPFPSTDPGGIGLLLAVMGVLFVAGSRRRGSIK